MKIIKGAVTDLIEICMADMESGKVHNTNLFKFTWQIASQQMATVCSGWVYISI